MKTPAALAAAGLSLLLVSMSWARPPYVQRIPFGRVNACANCHVNPQGGGPRNPFGQAFGQAHQQWTPELAAADSDGDGASNGAELQEATGRWAPGGAEAGAPALVTLPGSAASVPAPAAAPEQTVHLVGVICNPTGASAEQVIGIFNGTGADVDLAGMVLETTGGSWTVPSGRPETVVPPQRALRIIIDGTRASGALAFINEPAGQGLVPLNARADFVALHPADDPTRILDYVQWGTTGQSLESAAVAAGQWTAGETCPNPPPGSHLRHDGLGDGAAHWAVRAQGGN